MKEIFKLLFLIIFLIPVTVLAVSSTSYEIEPGTDSASSYHSSTSSKYSLDGVFESVGESNSSTNYILESGGPLPWYCGDGFVDPDEQCESDLDGSFVGSDTCLTQGFDLGSVSCDNDCRINVSTCESVVGSFTSFTSIAAQTGDEIGVIEEEGGEEDEEEDIKIYPVPVSSSSPNAPSIAPVFTSGRFFTYQTTLLLYGSISDEASRFLVDGTNAEPNFLSNNDWNIRLGLSSGQNIFKFTSLLPDGTEYSTYTSIVRRQMADATDDGVVDDFDLSHVVSKWQGFSRESDFNEDGQVDDYDLSILSAHWTQ